MLYVTSMGFDGLSIVGSCQTRLAARFTGSKAAVGDGSDGQRRLQALREGAPDAQMGSSTARYVK